MVDDSALMLIFAHCVAMSFDQKSLMAGRPVTVPAPGGSS
jgi:hypothetical protein